MIFRQIEQALEAPKTVTVPYSSPSIDVASKGGDSIAVMLVISSASTPGTATAVLQGSLDNVNFVSIGTPTAISANGLVPLTQDRPPYRYYRVSYAIASGSFVSTSFCLVKGDLQ